MARPKPTIIATYQRGDKEIQVCDCQAIYAVFYRGRPIKIRSTAHDVINGFKYGKSSFPEPGHAVRLAQQLNLEFNTKDYTVVELRIGNVFQV